LTRKGWRRGDVIPIGVAETDRAARLKRARKLDRIRQLKLFALFALCFFVACALGMIVQYYRGGD